MLLDQLLIFTLGFLLGGITVAIIIWIVFFRKKIDLQNPD